MNQAAQQQHPQQQAQPQDGRGPQHGGGHRQRYQSDDSIQPPAQEAEASAGEAEIRSAVVGEQPEPREILIAAAPPEG